MFVSLPNANIFGYNLAQVEIHDSDRLCRRTWLTDFSQNLGCDVAPLQSYPIFFFKPPVFAGIQVLDVFSPGKCWRDFRIRPEGLGHPMAGCRVKFQRCPRVWEIEPGAVH